MVRRLLGLSEKELKKSKNALMFAMTIVLSVTLALLIEYIVEDNLHEMKFIIQLACAGFVLLMLVIISVQSSK